MADAATSRQKQFLRALGCKDVAKLSKQDASQLIDKLLADEKASGKTFPCPYCKARFGPRPKRTKKCPSCGRNIVQLCGKFYTEEQADARYQTEWLKECRQDNKSNVADDWREEKKFRREFGEPVTVGYFVTAGPACPHTKKVEGLLVLIEDAYDTPDLLPPYDECRHDSCECEYTIVLANEVPRGTRVAEWDSKADRAKQITRQTSPVSIQKQRRSGCAAVVWLAAIGLLSLVLA